MSCMQNWFIQREKTMYILLTSWLRFHIKKKKKFLYLFQMMHSIYHKQFSDAWKNLKLFPKWNARSRFILVLKKSQLAVKEKYNSSRRYIINYYWFYHIWLLWTINRSRSDLSKTSLFEFVSKISGSVQQNVFHRRKKI